MSNPLRVLITNIQLKGRSGTEVVVRDLASGLKAVGHHPMVYAPAVSEIANELTRQDIPVVSSLDKLPGRPDVIHGHHHVETLQALWHFPGVPAIFVCHDRLAWHDAPPILPRIRRYVAVDHNTLQRLKYDYKIPDSQIRVIFNAVDLDRFRPRSPLPDKPGRAVIFSNYAGEGTHLEAIRAACREISLPLSVIGIASGNPVMEPEKVLGQYDLVFAKARAAIEAIVIGTAVIVCDAGGLGGMATADKVEEFRKWNFGMQLLQQPLEPSLIVSEIRRYDAADAQKVSQYMRTRADLRAAVEDYVTLYRELIAERLLATSSIGDEIREYVTFSAQKIHDLEVEVADLAAAPGQGAGNSASGEQLYQRLIVERSLLKAERDRYRRKYQVIDNSAVVRYIMKPIWRLRAALGGIRKRVRGSTENTPL